MKLRSRKVLGDTVLPETFMDTYFKLRSEFDNFDLLKEYSNRNDIESMKKICNLYFSFILYCSKKGTLELREKLLENKIMTFETVKNLNDKCYICGDVQKNDIITKCSNNHVLHLQCLYEKIIINAVRKNKSYYFNIDYDCINCDYCRAPMYNK